MTRRILIVHYTPPGVIGGVEHIIQEHVRLLTERGFRCEVAAGRPGAGDIRAHVLPEIDAAGAGAAAIEHELAAGVISGRFHEARRNIAARLAVLAADADALIVHNAFTLHFSLPLTAALWDLASRRKSGRVIAWCHDLSWVNPLYLPQMHSGYPWDLLRTPAPNTVYVTVSAERKGELTAIWGGERAPIRVVPNGIDVAEFLRLSDPTCQVIERYDLFRRDLVLLLPVRITRRKNVEAGIRAVRALKDRGRNVVFLVSGPTAPHHPVRSRTYLDELKELRTELGVEQEVIFLADELGENLDDRTVAELYTVADALLFPSAQEGFGLPILEAGLSRLPAVVSDIPIFAEVGDADVHRVPLEAGADRIAAEIIAAVDTGPGRLFRRVLHTYRWEAIVDRDILPLLSVEPR